MAHVNPSTLSDLELLTATALAAQTERDATARIVMLLAEVDSRRLYLGEGYSSLFAFCTRRLRMSEHAAYARIAAARVSRRIPGILDRLADGRLSLTTVGLLAPHLDDDNCEWLLEAAAHQSKREVERLVAALHRQPAIPAMVRALPRPAQAVESGASQSVADEVARTPAAVAGPGPAHMPTLFHPVAAPRRTAAIAAPLGPREYLLRVTIGEETQRKLERARGLLRHQVPDGDLAAIIDRALTLLVAKAERTKFAATSAPQTAPATALPAKRTRRIPAAIRRAVWARDQGRCTFTSRDGRCGETGFLEFHHVIPYGRGGPSTVENLELRCQPHNAYEAELAGLGRPPVAQATSGPSLSNRSLRSG